MTQAGAKSAPLVKKLTLEPLFSLEEARKKFEDHFLDNSHVKLRLTESTHVLTPEGETKFLFLKNVLPEPIVDLAWRTLSKLKFRPAKNSR